MSNENKGYTKHQKIEIIAIIIMTFSAGVLVQMFLTPFIISYNTKTQDIPETTSSELYDEITDGKAYIGTCRYNGLEQKYDCEYDELPQMANYTLKEYSNYPHDSPDKTSNESIILLKAKDIGQVIDFIQNCENIIKYSPIYDGIRCIKEKPSYTTDYSIDKFPFQVLPNALDGRTLAEDSAEVCYYGEGMMCVYEYDDLVKNCDSVGGRVEIKNTPSQVTISCVEQQDRPNVMQDE